jgi:cytochrome P450
VFALGAECNRAVLSDMESYHSQRVPGPPESRSFHVLTSGLFSMNTAKHQQQRRLMAPAFHKKRVDGYRDAMVDGARAMLDGWKVGETRDVLLETQRLTFAVAMRTLFGITPTDATFDLGDRILEVVAASMSPLTMISPNLPLTPRRRLSTLSASVEADLRELVAQRRGEEGDDVLSTLVRTRDEGGDALTDDELVGQMFLLFFAGHDTTRNALAWTLLLLAQHPRVLDELTEELRPLGGDAPTVEGLAKLTRLDGVVKESLRLFPSAPFTMRSAVKPVEIAGHALPAGSEIVLSYYHTHRDPDIYPEPAKFRPDRWANLQPAPWAYVPFGGGARMCIGAGFAALEIRLVLAMLLQRFRPELADGQRVDRKTTIVLSPAPGLPMTLRAAGSVGRRASLRGQVLGMADLSG